jgi:hypothetical protein
MNKKTIELITVFALASFLVAYFAYQVAYGMTTGPNGMITMTQGNKSASLRAQENPIDLSDQGGNWTIYNSTTGSSGIIVFHDKCNFHNGIGVDGTTTCNYTFDRSLNGRILKGEVDLPILLQRSDMTFCYAQMLVMYEKDGNLKAGCSILKATVVSSNGNLHRGLTSTTEVTLNLYFGLCKNRLDTSCNFMKNIESYSDHLVFLDGHHDTIHLVR